MGLVAVRGVGVPDRGTLRGAGSASTGRAGLVFPSMLGNRVRGVLP